MFIIDPRKEASIYKAWKSKAVKRLRDMFHDIRENDASTHWLTDEILQALRTHWDLIGLKAKQMKARRCRESARDGSLYTRGSTTIEDMQLRMVNIIFYLFSYSISILNII